MGLKRSRSAEFPSYTDEPDMHILVAGEGQPLVAHYDVLRHCSVCVRDLPRTADTPEPVVWDLQELVLEGESSPVSAEVVQRWLDLVYSRLDAGRRVRRISDLDEARPLLAFADACGTSQVVIDDLGRRLLDNPDLGLSVVVGEGAQRLAVKLALRDVTYCASATAGLRKVGAGRVSEVVQTGDFAPHAYAFSVAVCTALESWLHLAGRLGMVPLCRALINFIKAQLVIGTSSVVFNAFPSIYSRRVFDCMPRELLFEALLRDGLMDTHSEVVVEGEGIKMTLNSPLAAAWFCRPVGATEKMVVDGVDGMIVRLAGVNTAPARMVLGIAQSAAYRIVQGAVEKTCGEAE